VTTSTPSLFGDDEPVEVPKPEPLLIAQWQVALLRKTLDARGLESMAERQALVERLVARPVPSLRALTSAEAIQLLAAISPPSGSTAGPAWDNREEETWIDRL
jgi:hypothetical protein